MKNKTKETEYLEMELDAETMAEVEELAKESNVPPFDMGLILLREAISSSYEAQAPPA